MTPRKKWANNWADVKYCSKQCRSRKLSSTDKRLESAMVDLLMESPGQGTICPSEAARKIRPNDWDGLREACRMAARRLVARGAVEMIQGQRAVDPSTAKGPVRLRRAPNFERVVADVRLLPSG
jgi:hypothetical protein